MREVARKMGVTGNFDMDGFVHRIGIEWCEA